MEDVRCPGCGGMIPFPEGKMPVCPRCGRGIELVEGGNGMWIVGHRQPQPQLSLAAPHDNDPLVRTYGKWKGTGIFIFLLGLACAAILFIDLWASYSAGGFYFGRDHFVLTGVGIVLALAGGILFLAGRAFKQERLRCLDNDEE